MVADTIEYFRKREAEERTAAAQAASDEAREIHLAMAEKYAERARARPTRITLTISAA